MEVSLRPRDRLFWGLLVAVSGLALLPIWMPKYLPMVDLPQHALQLSIWQHWDDPDSLFRPLYRFNWLAAQQLAQLLVEQISLLLPLIASLKVAISMFVLGVPLACLLLLNEVESNRWFTFLIFPTVYSYSFFWGFLPFLLATPLAIAQFALAHRYMRRPTLSGAIQLNLCSLLVFFSHPLVFAYSGIVCAAMVVTAPGPLKRRLRCLMPLLLALPLPLLWFFLNVSSGIRGAGRIWSLGAHRLLEFLALVPGTGNGVGLLCGIVLLLVPFLFGYRFHSSWSRRIPFLLTCAFFFLVPEVLMAAGSVYRRFAVFALPTLLYALEPRSGREKPFGFAWFFLPGLACVWFVLLSIQFWHFDHEARPFDQILDAMRPGRKALSLMFDYSSNYCSCPAYLQFPAWYQVLKGGLVDYSFADFYTSRYRYRPEFGSRLPLGFEAHAGDFSWDEHSYDYTYFVFRGRRQDWEALLPGGKVSVKENVGSWWLLERR